MTLLHREFSPKNREKSHIDTSSARTLGKKTMNALRWGPEVTSDMLDPKLSRKIPLAHKIKGLPTEQVANDPTILIASNEKDILMRLPSRGAGDYTEDSRWHNSNN